jgi:hypothetical protein
MIMFMIGGEGVASGYHLTAEQYSGDLAGPGIRACGGLCCRQAGAGCIEAPHLIVTLPVVSKTGCCGNAWHSDLVTHRPLLLLLLLLLLLSGVRC